MAFPDDVTALLGEIYSKDPSHLGTARLWRMLRTLNDNWPAEHAPAHDLFRDVDERQDLFARWTTLCDQRREERPNALVVGVFLALPISNLHHYVQNATKEPMYFIGLHNMVQKGAYDAILAFLGKGAKRKTTSPPSTPLPAATSEATLTPLKPADRPSPLSQSIAAAASAAPPEVASASKRKRKATSALAKGQEEKIMADKHRRTASNPFTSEWAAKHSPGQLSPALSTSSLTSSVTRSRRAVSAATVRDKNTCVLTGHAFPEAARIFPYSATKSPETALESISRLVDLWDKNLSDKWRSLICDVKITESARNLICLNRHLHALWGAACFGLQPLCTAEEAIATKSVRLQFHWLPRGRFKPLQVLDDKSPQMLRDSVRESDFVAHRSNGIPIETGDVFTICADDTDDLPSVDLLCLQWHLVQLASMAGFGEVIDIVNNDEEEEPRCPKEQDQAACQGELDDDFLQLAWDGRYDDIYACHEPSEDEHSEQELGSG